MGRNSKRKRKESEEEGEDFVVEVITHARFADASKQKEGWEYLVKWDGYDDDTWESAANLAACQRLLASFWGDVGNEDYKEGTVVAASETWINQERKLFKIEAKKEMEAATKARRRNRVTPSKKKPNMVVSGPEDSDDDVPLANLATSPKFKGKSPASKSASRKATKPEPTTKKSPISVTVRAQQTKAELTGRNALSPNPPLWKEISKGASISVHTASLSPASLPFPKSQTHLASTPSLPFPALASSYTPPSVSRTTEAANRFSLKPPTPVTPPAIPLVITKRAMSAIPSLNSPTPASVNVVSMPGSAPPLVLEGRRLQPPPRYSGPLPQSNTQISQSAGRLHVQSSPIPAGSSASRLTPTAPVLSNSERESRRRPAVTSETELLSVLPENAFLLSLAKRWKEPPLSYYTMVAEKTATLLQRLAEWPTTLAHHPTFAVPNYEEFPTSSFVVEDLLAMDRPLIHYKELCAQDSTPTDTVSAVLDMLFKSHLMQPWRTGQKLISTYDIVATDKGMLRCRLDWPAIVQQLGVGFAFGDYRWQHTPEELSKIFPPMSPKSSKSAPERAQYLDRRGKEPWVASVQTPPGWVSDTHTDLSSVAQAIVHCDGEKLCLFWPSTSQNLEWWGLPRIRHTSRLEEALDALEGLEVMHITEPCTFIIPPFCIHAVITFAGSTHTCVSFAHAAHWPMAKEGLEFCKRLIRDPIYPTSSAVKLVRKLVHEASVWEQAIEPNSEATAYLAAWMVDMAPYRDQPAENDEYLDWSFLHTDVFGSRPLSDDDLTEC